MTREEAVNLVVQPGTIGHANALIETLEALGLLELDQFDPLAVMVCELNVGQIQALSNFFHNKVGRPTRNYSPAAISEALKKACK